jgi:hypothetical protein
MCFYKHLEIKGATHGKQICGKCKLHICNQSFFSAMNTKLIPQAISLMGTPSLKAPQPICHSLKPNRFQQGKSKL